MLFRFCLVCVLFASIVIADHPQLGQQAPSFKAESTTGKINFPKDYKGQWVVFVSFPGVFTPVCSKEARKLGILSKDLDNCKIVGITANSNYSHKLWLEDLEKKDPNFKPFPLISDVQTTVASKYDLIHQKINTKKMVRAVYIIDPKGNIRTIIFYPIVTGRNTNEIKRIVKALQATDEQENSVTMPDWQEGQDLIKCPTCSSQN